jgi:AcrR family transcriptional regulator
MTRARSVPASKPAPKAPTERISRRTQILGEAARLFAEQGFLGASIDELGAAVGISGPALYRHFASKESMLAEMLIAISEELLAGARSRVTPTIDPNEALGRLIDWQVEFALDNPALIVVQARDLSNLGPRDQGRVRSVQRAYLEIWINAVRGVAPALERTTARAAVQAVLGLINSTPYSARIDRPAMATLLHDMAVAAFEALPYHSNVGRVGMG